MTYQSLRTTALALAFSLAALAPSAPASARTRTLVVQAHAISDEYRTTTVNFADLNLTSPQGQRSLHYRVGYAIENVCGSEGNRDLGVMMEAVRCSKAAWNLTRPRMEVAIERAVALAAAGRGTGTAAATLVIAAPLR